MKSVTPSHNNEKQELDGGKHQNDAYKPATEHDFRTHLVPSVNKERKLRCACPLKWSSDLANQAQSWVNQRRQAENCQVCKEHTCPLDPGMSVYSITCPTDNKSCMSAINDPSALLREAQTSWRMEGYNYTRYSDVLKAPNWTQTMWKGSKNIGCASTMCQEENGESTGLVACQYDPPGNGPPQSYVKNIGNFGCLHYRANVPKC